MVILENTDRFMIGYDSSQNDVITIVDREHDSATCSLILKDHKAKEFITAFGYASSARSMSGSRYYCMTYNEMIEDIIKSFTRDEKEIE